MQRLDKFRTPDNFRGRNKLVVQLWWVVDALLFKPSPQVLYGWRRLLLRLFGAKIGTGVIIRPNARITYPWKLSVGDHSWVGDFVELYTLGEIRIGSNSVVSQYSHLCTGSHDYQSETFDIYAESITIGDHVWVCSDVYIGPGVTICDGTVVGARSSVFSDIFKQGIYRGSPAKYAKDRFS